MTIYLFAMRRITSIFLLFATTILSSCQNGEKNSSNTGETLYETLEVSLSDRTLTTGYSATISGVQTVEVRPQVSGMIVDILIEEGESVSKDQVLFIIENIPDFLKMAQEKNPHLIHVFFP